MKILVIDDKMEELGNAYSAVRAMGWGMAIRCDVSLEAGYERRQSWIKAIDDVDGVVTDLMWKDREDHGEKPMGLLVVAHALSRGKPVVICTNCGEYAKGGHDEAVNFILAGYLNYVKHEEKAAFDVEEHKDWGRAMKLLARRMEHSKKPEEGA